MVTQTNGIYHLEMAVDVEYVSRDNRYITRMDCTTILMDVQNRGKGRDKNPYRLHARTDLQNWDLPPAGKGQDRYVRKYVFYGTEEGVPLLGSSTSCKILSIGKARIRGISRAKSLKPAKLKNVGVS